MKEDKLGFTKTCLDDSADDPKRSLLSRDRTRTGVCPHRIVGETYTFCCPCQRHQRTLLPDRYAVPPAAARVLTATIFEEMFTLLEGEIEVTFRGEKSTVRAGETVNIPANAPHFFTNASEQPVRLLCMCTPAGQEEFFMEVGVPVANRTTPPPKLDEAGQAAFIEKAKALAPKYQTEMLPPA